MPRICWELSIATSGCASSLRWHRLLRRHWGCGSSSPRFDPYSPHSSGARLGGPSSKHTRGPCARRLPVSRASSSTRAGCWWASARCGSSRRLAPYEADLAETFAALREAGERARRENPDVLSDTKIEGISAFGPLMLTVRTSTRVRPGRHDAAAAALRLAIKEAFDRRASDAPRKSLVPEKLGGSARLSEVLQGAGGFGASTRRTQNLVEPRRTP